MNIADDPATHRVRVRVVRRNKVEVFERDLLADPDIDVAIKKLVDTFEGQIGSVLSVIDTSTGAKLYWANVQDLGATQ